VTTSPTCASCAARRRRCSRRRARPAPSCPTRALRSSKLSAGYGDLLGIAFQMADDMVDFSPSSGKPVGLDIRQRVLSLPLIYAAEDRAVGPEIRRLLAGSLGEAEVGRVADLVTSSDALQRVRGEAKRWSRPRCMSSRPSSWTA